VATRDFKDQLLTDEETEDYKLLVVTELSN
jgi:hypothetical protein